MRGRLCAEPVLKRVDGAEKGQQLDDLVGEIIHRLRADIAPQDGRGQLVGAGGATQPEVDPVAVQGDQSAELLGDDHRGVVREHDPAGADADARRRIRNRTDQHGRGRTGDSGHSVVFRDPEPPVTERVRQPRRLDRLRERLGMGHPLIHGREVEHGQRKFGQRSHCVLNPVAGVVIP